MTRLDAAPLRKRSAVRGEAVVEVKAGDAVVGVVEGWMLERFVVLGKKEIISKKKKGTGKKKPPRTRNSLFRCATDLGVSHMPLSFHPRRAKNRCWVGTGSAFS